MKRSTFVLFITIWLLLLLFLSRTVVFYREFRQDLVLVRVIIYKGIIFDQEFINS